MLNRRDDIGIWRSISVGKLRELLQPMNADYKIVVSEVGELLIFEGNNGDEDNWRRVGYIALAQEMFEPWEEEVDEYRISTSLDTDK